jgi:hypothetical protein
MSLVGKNGTPAERQRGLIFVEDFRSVDDVVRNGMVVGGGTPTFGPGAVYTNGTTDDLQYPIANTTLTGSRAFTVMMELSPTALNAARRTAVYLGGANGIYLGLLNTNRFGGGLNGVTSIDSNVTPDLSSWYWLALSHPGGAGTLRLYLNGIEVGSVPAITPAITAGLVEVGMYGPATFPYAGYSRNIRIFDQQLSAEEILQYATNRVYSYRSQPTINLQMRNTDHTATATLDTSGNGRNGVFSATVPSKIVGRHGYDFVPASSNNLTCTLNGTFNTSEWSGAIEFEPDYVLADGNQHYLWDSSNGARYMLVVTAVGDLLVWVNSSAVAQPLFATVSPYWYKSGRNTIIVSAKSGKINVWLNDGRVGVDVASAWAPGNPAACYVGSSFVPSLYHDGRITRFASFPQALTTLQVYDLLTNWQMRASEA